MRVESQDRGQIHLEKRGKFGKFKKLVAKEKLDGQGETPAGLFHIKSTQGLEY